MVAKNQFFLENICITHHTVSHGVLKMWNKQENSTICTYWTNRSKSESQIVIMNSTEFYMLYPELNKRGDKLLVKAKESIFRLELNFIILKGKL